MNCMMGKPWDAHSESEMRTCITIGAVADYTVLNKARHQGATHRDRVSLITKALREAPPRGPRAVAGTGRVEQCRMDGCTEPVRARGLCSAHYATYEKHLERERARA
jgi:hypothetical protein